MRPRDLAISLALHLIVLAALAHKGGFGLFEKQGTGKGKFESKDPGQIIDIETVQKSENDLVTPGEDPLEAERKRLEKLRKNCTPYFGGIGITLDAVTGAITQVHRGYPAEAHGIQVGDVLMGGDVKGEVGTEVVVKVRRGNEVLHFLMIRERICLKEVQP